MSEININSADIGFDGKHSSVVNLDRISISDVNFWFAAFKKQEQVFWWDN